jgi:hypothetical protein
MVSLAWRNDGDGYPLTILFFHKSNIPLCTFTDSLLRRRCTTIKVAFTDCMATEAQPHWIQMASRHWPCLMICCCRCSTEKKASIFVGCKLSWGIDGSTRKQITSSFRNNMEMATSASHLDSCLVSMAGAGQWRDCVRLIFSTTILSRMK